MYQKKVNQTEFMEAHAQGLKDPQLAEKFNISIATVKRRRKEYGLGSNCPNNNRGRLAEVLTQAYFENLGMSVVTPANHNAPFDLLVDGWRVEVKVGRQRGYSASFEFRLPHLRYSFYREYEYRKDYQRDTDYFALVVLNEEGNSLAHVYVLPSSHWQSNITVSPDCPFCEFQEFRNKALLLRAPFKAA